MKWILGLTFIYTPLLITFSIYLGLKLGKAGERIKSAREKVSKGYGLEDDKLWRLELTLLLGVLLEYL